MLIIVPVIRFPLQILMWRRKWSCLVKEILQFVHLNCLFQWNAISCRRMFQAIAKLSSQSGHWYLNLFSLGGLMPPSGDFFIHFEVNLTTFVSVNVDCALSVCALPLVTEITYEPCVIDVWVRLLYHVLRLLHSSWVQELFALVCTNGQLAIPVFGTVSGLSLPFVPRGAWCILRRLNSVIHIEGS